ncbi:MAG: AI-2E family transporter [Actinomycetaceae bacterium]|nr:AI-2E family transporter [Actinomycetaceae bacterium]
MTLKSLWKRLSSRGSDSTMRDEGAVSGDGELPEGVESPAPDEASIGRGDSAGSKPGVTDGARDASTPESSGAQAEPSAGGTGAPLGTTSRQESVTGAIEHVARPDGESPTGADESSSGGQVPADGDAARRDSSVPVGMKVIMVVALVAVCCAGLREIREIFAPAFFALTLVLTVRPIHRWLVRMGLPPFLSGLSTILALAAGLLGVIGLTVWSLVRLPETLGQYSGNLQDLVGQLQELAERHNLRTDQILDNINTDQIVSLVTTVINYMTSTGTLVVLIAATMLFITVDTMTMEARSKIVDNHDSSLHQALSSFEGRVRQYWLVSTIFGIIVAIVDFFVLRMLHVPEAFGWAMVSFVTNYIPNIGFVLGVIPPALMGLIDSGWVTAVWVVILYTVVNAVIQGIFQPKITGDAVGLSTTITFLSLLFWTVVVGPLGAILAVPLTLFAKAVLIDSSPGTRWLEVFLIPESEARKRDERGIYDEENPAPDEFVDFMTAELQERESGRRPLLLRRTERQR